MSADLKQQSVLRLAIPAPLRKLFDYLPPKGVSPAEMVPGIRIRVPFGRTQKVGLLIEVASETEVPRARLKHALQVLDDDPLLAKEDLSLLKWSSGYYHHPLGDVMQNALPILLRRGDPASLSAQRFWTLTPTGLTLEGAAMSRSPRQRELHQRLLAAPGEVSADAFADLDFDWRRPLARMQELGWVSSSERPLRLQQQSGGESPHQLNPDQRAAVEAICANLKRFKTYLVNGITGSGKTEVYLRAIEAVVDSGGQALVLVPEIGLTPQLVERFSRRFEVPLVVLHSGLNDRERLNAWLLARSGEARIVLGTRSAVFTPMPNLSLIVIDEEHDASFKQQEGFRYSARDLAIIRARNRQIPVVLGSATPSLESLHNLTLGHSQELRLTRRAGEAKPPSVAIVDMRGQPVQQGLSEYLRVEISRHLGQQGQVLLFLNRRGFAPTLICHACGWVAGCRRCDARLTLHQRRGRMLCHHCGSDQALPLACPECAGEELIPLGKGTERIEQALETFFPDVPVWRIDRDSTRRKGSLEQKLAQVHLGDPCILVGTQMLAKGHHFPGVTLAAILDADRGLFGVDFRAGERMAQLIIQVAGRSGRADRQGTVLVQTYHPEHPLLGFLAKQDYQTFAQTTLVEREAAQLPPFSRIALLRAEAPQEHAPMAFLREVAAIAIESGSAVEVLGPVPAPMERRAGRYRAQLLLQASGREHLHPLVSHLIPRLETLKSARRVRWSLDIDPVDMF